MKNVLLLLILTATLLLISSCVIISSNQNNIHHQIFNKFMGGSTKILFKIFHFLYKKEYNLNSAEGLRRYQIFKNNLKEIKKINSEEGPHKLGITPFTDQTKEEYEKDLEDIPEFREIEESGLNISEKLSGLNIPRKVDWSNYFGEARHQLACGSCWAFSTSGAIEANMKIKYNQDFTPSVQQLIDCDTENHGCHGGISAIAMKYFIQDGAVKEEDYPYINNKHRYCNRDYRDSYKIVSRYEVCTKQTCNREQLFELVSKGPVTAYMDANHLGFSQYTEGLMYVRSCMHLNHLVIIVGYDADEKYWLIRNSHGPNWGMNGYAKVPFTNFNNSCFLEN
jgi:C1A family cysteine protease